ncbi:MAG: thermonuclease family protein [Candidatus Paceibacterota bacterium]|jgi:micrococcal nuclease
MPKHFKNSGNIMIGLLILLGTMIFGASSAPAPQPYISTPETPTSETPTAPSPTPSTPTALTPTSTFSHSQEYENVVAKAQGENVVNFETAKVARVVDGDTIELEGGEKVRYIGIDTPETVDPRKPAQCYGAEASAKNKELVLGKTVRLAKDVTDKDKYGRLLRYVYVGDVFVNLALVEGGYAFSYSYPPDIAHQSDFVAAEQSAQAKDAGLWGACTTLLNNTNSRSSAITAPVVSPEPAQNGCAIKGNVSSTGEKIYHVSGCGSYAKTVIDESKGEKMFCTEAEATAAGWRKAQNCP